MVRSRAVMTCIAAALASAAVMLGQDRPLLLVVTPDEDTTTTSSPAYRLSGSTRPGCTVALDGVQQRVYSSGAFAGLLSLQVGENRFTLIARDQNGQTQEKTLLIVRNPPLQSTPSDTLAIDSLLLEPAEELWLRAGDVLAVQCKGTPGCRATFLDGLPMVELPDSATNGVRGIYRGSCVVTDLDTMDSTAVTFRLVDSAGHEVTAESRGRVTILSSRTPLVGVTRGERPFLNYGLGDDRLGGAKMSILVPGVRLSIYRHLCFRPLSQAIYDEVLKTGLAPFGNVGGFNFLLNSPTELPSVLVELAFMSHPEDEIRLLDDEFRKELARRILKGVEKFLDDAEE